MNTVFLCFWAVFHWLVVQVPSGPPRTDGAAASMQKEESGPAQLLGVRLPPLISKEELGRYAAMLNLAEPQVLYVQRFHDQYLQKGDALLKAETPELTRLSSEGGAAMDLWPTVEAAEIGDLLTKRERNIVEKLKLWDLELFLQMRSVLADTQLPEMARVEMRRQRELCWLRDCYLPG